MNALFAFLFAGVCALPLAQAAPQVKFDVTLSMRVCDLSKEYVLGTCQFTPPLGAQSFAADVRAQNQKQRVARWNDVFVLANPVDGSEMAIKVNFDVNQQIAPFGSMYYLDGKVGSAGMPEPVAGSSSGSTNDLASFSSLEILGSQIISSDFAGRWHDVRVFAEVHSIEMTP